MGILSFGTVLEAAEREQMKFQQIRGNAKASPRFQRDKGPMLQLLILLSWAFDCGVAQVAGQPLPFTKGPPTLEIGLAPAGDQPGLPIVQVPSQVGNVPQRAAPQPPPPPPPPPAGQFQQFQQVLSSLRINNYTTGAQYISDYLFLLPLGSTLFVPTNAAFDVMFPSPVGPLLAYQAIMQQFSFRELILFPVGIRFATLVANNNTVVITSVAPYDFRVDNVRIVEGDICFSTTSRIQISCHGVDGFFNMTEWGKVSLDQLAPVPAPEIGEPPVWELISPTSASPSVERRPVLAPSPHLVAPKSGVAARAEKPNEVLSRICVMSAAVILVLLICCNR